MTCRLIHSREDLHLNLLGFFHEKRRLMWKRLQKAFCVEEKFAIIKPSKVERGNNDENDFK